MANTTLDFKALKDKLSQLQGQNSRSAHIFKPKKGDTTIRIVPWKDNRNNPFIELYFHYIGEKTYLSPITHGGSDPIADFADKLRATGDRDDWTNAKQFTPKLRTYVPVVVRGEESNGVKFWSFGKTVYTQLLSYINDEDYGDITDPVSGRDLVLAFTPKTESKTGFAETNVRIKPNQTPLHTNAAIVKSLLSEQPNINELYTAPSVKELEDILQRFLNPSASNTASAETTNSVGTKETVVASTDAGDDVEEQLNNLFSDDK